MEANPRSTNREGPHAHMTPPNPFLAASPSRYLHSHSLFSFSLLPFSFWPEYSDPARGALAASLLAGDEGGSRDVVGESADKPMSILIIIHPHIIHSQIGG